MNRFNVSMPGVWPDFMIRQWLNEGCIPSNYVKVNPNSLDLSLADRVQWPKWWWRNPLTRWAYWHRLSEAQRDSTLEENEHLYWTPKRKFKRLVLWPGDFVLCATHERTVIPNNVCPLLFSKSTTGRLGIEHLHAGLGDAGFNGTWTLELKNLGHFPVILYPFNRYFQVIFITMVAPAQDPYRGRYQGQGIDEYGPTPARREKL